MRSIQGTSLRLALLLVVTVLVGPADAALETRRGGDLEALQKSRASLYGGRQVAPLAQFESARLAADWASLAVPGSKIYLDTATGEPALVKSAPVALIPGKGNSRGLDQVAAELGREVKAVDEAVVQALVDRFVGRNLGRLGVDQEELRPRGAARVSENLWVVTYEHAPAGVVVRGSRLTFVIGHGNLILWGSDGVFPLAPEVQRLALLDAAAAGQRTRDYVRWDAGRDRVVEAPRLVYLLERGGESSLRPGEKGRHHRLVWEMVFKRAGERGSWMSQVDAVSGEVLQFGDINRYAWIRGGVEPVDWTDEQLRPMPRVGLGGGMFASAEGAFTAAGSTTASLDGERVFIRDRCGDPAGAPTVTGSGDLSFGSGPANPDGSADCATNGIGDGATAVFNTHASRSAYFNATRLKDRWLGWLPDNTWLADSHEVRVNINGVCDAYWDVTEQFNGFFQEGLYGGGPLICYNSAEVAGVAQHEVGHGIDQNDVQGLTTDGGSGEAYADVVAALEQRSSCIGTGFWNQLCEGYGFPCRTCTGVRDIDYAGHEDAIGTPISTPLTTLNFVSSCPTSFFTFGPCSKSGHCESHIASGAFWDYTTRKLTTLYDSDTAWYRGERTFVLGMQVAGKMFNCNSVTFASDGCDAVSWFNGFLAVDDDDGNLLNGTPHAALIFEAFDDHDIACGSSADTSNQSSTTCPALAAPVLGGVVAGSGEAIDLSWAAVANAQGYAVLKNQDGCSAAPHLVASLGAGATSFSDSDVAPNQDYFYRLVALGGAGTPADNACLSALSNCAEVGISNVLFEDGFESGNTSSWSATVQ